MIPYLLLSLFLSLAHALTVPLPPEAEVQKRLAAHLEGKGDFQDRAFRRIGERTLEFQGFISTEADYALLKTVLKEPAEYHRWLTPNINKRPSGGDYLIKLQSFHLAPEATQTLLAKLLFDLPVFKKEIDCYMDVKTEEKGANFWLTATVDSNRPGTYIEGFQTVIQVFPKGPGRVWLYAIGHVKFKNWLLYEALPDRLLTRETGERLQIVIDNYLAEESLRRQSAKKKGSPLKEAAPVKR